MPLTDSCPKCLRRGIAPVAVRSRGAATVFGYRCPSCRHVWTTSRLRSAYPTLTEPATTERSAA